MKAQTIVNKVLKFQKELEKYYKETGDDDITDIGTTIIGSGGHIEYQVFPSVIVRTEKCMYDNFKDDYIISDSNDMDELIEQVQYDRKRLKKGWRVWRSDNPDVELEKDDEEE